MDAKEFLLKVQIICSENKHCKSCPLNCFTSCGYSRVKLNEMDDLIEIIENYNVKEKS
jgi:hypothetical protein